ncbi:MAG: serine hydrolase domain-containing protein [Bacteroidota bacterium]
MKKYLIILISLFLFSCEEAEVIDPIVYTCQLSGPDNSDMHPNKAELEIAMEKIGQVTAGVQIAIKDKNGLSLLGAYGMADIPNNVALSVCHKTMVGSISKTFTAVLIMQLQDEGLLSIDDMLKDHLSQEVIGEIANANEVSIRQLLNHTSGIRDYLGVEHYLEALNTPFLQLSQEEKLRYIYGKKSAYEVGEQYAYSNTNYVLLGLIVEARRNMSLWNAVEAYISQPLGLESTEMGTHDMPIPAGTARPYRNIRGNKFEDVMGLAVSDAATGDGGIASNMQDLTLFFEALFGGQLLSEASFNQMHDSEMIEVGEGWEDFPQWPNEAYGLGLSLWNTPYGIAYGHTGSTTTYEAYSFYFPAEGISISIGYNGSGPNDFGDMQRELREELFRIAFE